MPKLTIIAIRYGRTEPSYRKASTLISRQKNSMDQAIFIYSSPKLNQILQIKKYSKVTYLHCSFPVFI